VVDPAFGDLVDRCGVQVVELLSAAAHRGDEICRLQHRQVLADRLAGHVEPRAQLAKTLSAAGIQAVEEPAATRIRQRLEHPVHRDVSPSC